MLSPCSIPESLRHGSYGEGPGSPNKGQKKANKQRSGYVIFNAKEFAVKALEKVNDKFHLKVNDSFLLLKPFNQDKIQKKNEQKVQSFDNFKRIPESHEEEQPRI